MRLTSHHTPSTSFTLFAILLSGYILTECGGNDVIDEDSTAPDSTTDTARDAHSDSVDGVVDSGDASDSSGDIADGETLSDSHVDDGALDAATDSQDAREAGDALDALDSRDTSLDAMDSTLDTSDTLVTLDTKDADALEVEAGIGPAAVSLGLAGNYVILAQSAISTVPTSTITGDIAISPSAASFITGFSLVRAGTLWTSTQVVGNIFSADNDAPTPTLLTTAINNMHAAYTDAATRPGPNFVDLATGAIGGLTLHPGLYNWGSSVTMTSNVTISGGPNDTWIFQVTGDLAETAAMQITLTGGASAKNIVWQVSGAVFLGTGAHFEGVILCKTAITLASGASVTGRLLAQTAVALDSSTLLVPPTP